MQQKIWRKVSVLCMVLALMMPSIVQATEIVATSETEVSTEKMAEETSEDVQVSNEKLSIEEGNQQTEPVIEESEPVVLEEENPTNVEEPTNKEENSKVPEKMGNAESLDEALEEEPSDSDTGVEVSAVIENGIEFELNHSDDKARAIAYHGTGGHVNIPATVFWKDWDFYVTHIGERAFYSKEITSVSLGPHIRVISNLAFSDNQLTSISFPNSLVWIGHSAFSSNQLTSVVIPDSVTTIQYAAFFNNRLESVHLGRGLSSLEASVLGKNNLRELNIPSSIKMVGAHVFEGSPLDYLNTEVEHVETLRDALDQGSMNLVLNRTILRALDYVAGTEREVKTIPGENIKFQLSKQYRLRSTADRVWEEYTPAVQWFKNDTSLSGETNPLLQLESVTPGDSGVYHAVVDGERFPDLTLEVIDESIEQAEFEFEFSGTEDESTATLIRYNGEGGDVVIPSETVNSEEGWDKPSPVTGIAADVFWSKELTSVELPDRLIRLEANAFRNNPTLNNIEFPDSLVFIGEDAFRYSSLLSVSIPDSVITIEASAFAYNPLTGKLTIPKSVKVIGARAFLAHDLSEIVIEGSPEIAYGGFHSATDNNSQKSLEVTILEKPVFVEGATFGETNLKAINGTFENMDYLRGRLSEYVMINVRERTILRTLDYEMDTLREQEVTVGEDISYKISNQYQLHSTENRVWDSYTPEVHWEKDETPIEGASSTLLELLNVQELDSGVYRAIVDGTIFPDLQLQVKPEMEPDIPSIDPSEPPVFPEEVNPDIEGLSIRYASDMRFNSAPFSLLDQTLLLANQDQQPMVTVQDMRPIAERSGWELLVSQDALFMNGAEIVMHPYVHQANQDNLLIEASSELVLNDAPQRFAGTTNAEQPNPAGIVSMGMESEKNPMSLRVPGKTGVNSYETTVHWQLVTGP